jgi:superfamily II RNA helicase
MDPSTRTTAPLAAVMPQGSPPASDQILDAFLSYVSDQGLSLYPAQEEAILELMEGKHLLLNTPTGSGKSLVATALHFKSMAEGKRSFYTCPIKALVNEKFFALCNLFGPENVGMMTGDASINRDAPILCCTAEILSNLCLRELDPPVDAVIMDEFHYYADKERGVAWQIPLLTLAKTTFLLMSATLGDTRKIEASLEALTGREVASVRSVERPVPLSFEYVETPLHETLEKLVHGNKAPVYLVNFTQRSAAEQAQNLTSVNFSSKEEKEQIREALQGARFDTPAGKDIQKYLRHGIGLHHAGLLPKYRLLVEKLAQTGLLKVISGTDTLGVGVNIPLRTVLFTQLCKFDGEKTVILSARDFHQISGRAGRKGFDDQGYVVAQAPEHVIENLKLAQKQASGKKVVKKQPPQKGYVHFDRQTFEKLIEKVPEPLESRFEVSHGMLLSILQSVPERHGGGYHRLVELILRAHLSDYLKRQQLKRAAVLFRSLREAGLVQLMREGKKRLVLVSPELQRDFSLMHTLALYLLKTLDQLDRASPTYALDVVTLVESILENPSVVLFKQLDVLKGKKVEELKAQGMEYAERMEELEKLEWPKPLRDFIYATFNEFERSHPWVGEANIRPKSVARDLLERFVSFNDYVREYGLQRSEGVLLRYLGEAYKTLVQTVPESFRDDTLEDAIAQLRVLLKQVDSSLLEEWEALRDPAGAKVRVAQEAPVPLPPQPLDANPRTFAIRVRAELHALVRALGRQNWEEALALIAPDDGWTEDKLNELLKPYYAEGKAFDLTPRGRKPQHTLMREEEPHQWSVQQNVLAPEGAEDEPEWVLDCLVDARPPVENVPFLRLLKLDRVG